MAIEALKRVFQLPVVKKEREVSAGQTGQRRPKQRDKGKQEKGKIDIKV